MVYVLNKNGQPLMPTENHGFVRKLLKSKKAKVRKGSPFTIQLLYETENNIQDIELKVDAGYQNIGLSACSDNKELFSGEVCLLEGQKQRLADRAKYRRTRRNRLRYRAPRFNNRFVPEGWLAPSIDHKLNSHVKIINKLTGILPVSSIIVEVANFDTQAIKNPDISGVEYQQGELLDFRNLREYVFYRDNYTCQFCGKNAFKDGAILRMHHLEYWKGNHSDTPANCTTACTKCHCSKNHEPGNILWGKEAIQKPLKAETFMSTVRWKIIDRLKELYNIPVSHTYGYLTKSKRIELDLPKTHYNDAYCIGTKQPVTRCETVFYTEKRKSNRLLEKFYDAKYIDSRDGTKKTGKELYSGRSTRNVNYNAENLHQYRGKKVSKGRKAIRTKRYMYQPHDLVKYNNQVYEVKGTHCNGDRVLLIAKPKNISIAIDKVKPYIYSNTLYIERS